jgi:hypothetical protein
VTEPLAGAPNPFWLSPQIFSDHRWLVAELPPDITPVPGGARFGESVELAGYELGQVGEDSLALTLYWRALAEVHTYATVFVHLLDPEGGLVSQHDGPPVGGAYTFPDWPAGALIADERSLALDSGQDPGGYRLAVGVYDPATLLRWRAMDASGRPLADDRVLLPLDGVAPQ